MSIYARGKSALLNDSLNCLMTAGWRAGSVSEDDSAALWLNLYPALCFWITFHAAPGEKDRGTNESTDKAWSESCRGSVQRRDRAATWQKEAKHDHFLTLSINRLSVPYLHPSGHPQYGLVISRSTDGCCLCVYKCVCIFACICVWMSARRPAILSPLAFNCPKHHQPLLRSSAASTEPSFRHEQKIRMRRGKAPALILYPLLGCSCPWI